MSYLKLFFLNMACFQKVLLIYVYLTCDIVNYGTIYIYIIYFVQTSTFVKWQTQGKKSNINKKKNKIK